MQNKVLKDLDLNSTIHWNLSPAELMEKSILLHQGTFTNTGALAINTGKYTGRSPKDKYVVCDELTKNSVWWGDVNHPYDPDKFDILYKKMVSHLADEQVYVHDCYACADPQFKLNIRVVTETPWASLFAHNMFLRYNEEELKDFVVDWTILCVPSFNASSEHGTRQGNFTIINFTKKILLIGGSGYTGEIKKGIFTVLNYILPMERNVLPMHCSANVGQFGDTALFFGLSGTGKTTLSADPQRQLIGDDEHGWADHTIFNFEGGCYAKCVGLSREKEPEIFDAITYGALLENIVFNDGTKKVDFNNTTITENTRVSYPIEHIPNIKTPSVGWSPDNIFFLTCDATGVLPPISKLSTEQAMYHFISGYTAKVAGTEMGITEPQLTFSACFGRAFLPLHPNKYAEMLGEKLKQRRINVWLVNTGWVGGSYGTGKRIKLKYTRELINNALKHRLNSVEWKELPIFGLHYPVSCPNVPSELLNPRDAWKDKDAYDKTLNKLASAFIENFEQYKDGVNPEILKAQPVL